MIKFLFLLPIIMCLVWWKYLDSKGFSIKDGIKGFTYIVIVNMVIISFFVIMIFITH